MADNIIPFDGRERLLLKVRGYLSAVDELIRDEDQSIEVLLKAFDCADDDLKVKIVIMLGIIARPKVLWPLLDIMRNPELGEAIRQAAAIQISVVGAFIDDTDDLVAELRSDLDEDAPFARANAAFALGWEGNMTAAPDLIDCLSDEDMEVQQAAVNALSNLHDDSLFKLLAQRLQKGAKEQQRSILYNLGHFPARHVEFAQICRSYLHHSDADLRYDALVVLQGVEPFQDLALYEHCLDDSDVRIRELALMRLRKIERSLLKPLMPKIRAMVNDPRSRVRQAATRLTHDIDSISLAHEGGLNEPL
ncbi:MAG: HEAT repeat domain-containing protein [Desulfobacteraceae bacterium]|jgi:HEAT repeat protein